MWTLERPTTPASHQNPQNPRLILSPRAAIMILAAAKRGTSLLSLESLSSKMQQWRGIRVKVRNNNLDQALAIMQRKMQSSGIERMIRKEQTCHIKNSEKRVLAKKNLERKIRSQDLARKLKVILVQKVR